ncbi:hypothetical protein VE03_03907 [Pseudogymnoascus sp. 23342-1-I1]|nr:hypothetical protein VE03_03907 [Pseudogymnoascus sp. 23342-1-I1]
MNNQQFRKLVLDTPARQSLNGDNKAALGATPRRDGGATALGSRMRSSIPMTPRSVATSGGNDFARQLAERQREAAGEQPTKKFRSVAAPRGAKLASGYVDRTQMRDSEVEDDKASRVKALEEMMKLQQIDQPTFEKLRDEIIGGDVNSVHLMKGLDYKLLERVRRGEDVLQGKSNENAEAEEDEEVDVDDEFEKLEEKEIVPVARERAAKHGEMARASLVPGKKRNRDQILAELKAARAEAKAKAGPSLGTKFKKVGASRNEPRIEKDERGREVLITVDDHGNEKRKVRRVQVEQPKEEKHALLMPDKDAAPLGMEVPDIPTPTIEEEDEDFDIFDGAGDDYDPLAGLEDDVDSEAEDGEVAEAPSKPSPSQTPEEEKASLDKLSMPPPPRPKAVVKARNYFGESTTTSKTSAKPALGDPTILAALKKASQIGGQVKEAKSEEDAARETKLQKMLQSQDRDADDIDMGFGSSRFADEEDFGDEKIKLSNWDGDDDEAEGGRDGKAKRKRGPKKRKGDANSAADVLKVMERRKAEDKS